jgi:hypothetical protein
MLVKPILRIGYKSRPELMFPEHCCFALTLTNFMKDLMKIALIWINIVSVGTWWDLQQPDSWVF